MTTIWRSNCCSKAASLFLVAGCFCYAQPHPQFHLSLHASWLLLQFGCFLIAHCNKNMFVFGRIPWFHFTKIVIPVKISACSTSSAGAFLNLFVLANETPDESMMIPQSSDRI